MNLRIVKSLLLFIVISGALGGSYIYYQLFGYENPETSIVIIDKGASSSKIADVLKENKIISNKLIFRATSVFATIYKKRYILPGEYEIPKNANSFDTLKKLMSGQRVIRKLTIPEGLTVKQISEIIENSYGLFGKFELRKDCSLMPDTYYYFYGDERESIFKRMESSFKEYLDASWEIKTTDLDNVMDVITLASIIEKETRVPEERPIVSSVYTNRIKKNMLLQADPTVIYAITNGYGAQDRDLTLDDLKFPSKFNTYVSPGFPPNPICCSGKASIKAALNPTNTDYIFFVADGKGGHIFAKNFADHTKNVQAYRKAKKESQPN